MVWPLHPQYRGTRFHLWIDGTSQLARGSLSLLGSAIWHQFQDWCKWTYDLELTIKHGGALCCKYCLKSFQLVQVKRVWQIYTTVKASALIINYQFSYSNSRANLTKSWSPLLVKSQRDRTGNIISANLLLLTINIRNTHLLVYLGLRETHTY